MIITRFPDLRSTNLWHKSAKMFDLNWKKGGVLDLRFIKADVGSSSTPLPPTPMNMKSVSSLLMCTGVEPGLQTKKEEKRFSTHTQKLQNRQVVGC